MKVNDVNKEVVLSPDDVIMLMDGDTISRDGISVRAQSGTEERLLMRIAERLPS